MSEGLASVEVVHTAADTDRVRTAWANMHSLIVLRGGGFFDLEVASTAKAPGKSACALESATA